VTGGFLPEASEQEKQWAISVRDQVLTGERREKRRRDIPSMEEGRQS